jgi:alpha-acetolactate decarboxylase
MLNQNTFRSALAIYLLFALNAIAAQGLFEITVYGNFKRMIHTSDASGKVALASIPLSANSYGVGALADLKGEILIWEGEIFVTPGESASGATQTPGSNDWAALLVTAHVNKWDEVHVARDMAQQEFEQFVINTAQILGINLNKPFPFIVLGEVTDYAWHVVTGKSKLHGSSARHGQGHATNRIFTGAKTGGKLFGFYSAKEHEGVISHPGERFHVHYADNDLKRSGHLDCFGIAKGAKLLLPKP